MNRRVEIARGVGVSLMSVLGSIVIFRMIAYYHRCGQKVPPISIIVLCLTGFAILLSFVGAFILLSRAKISK